MTKSHLRVVPDECFEVEGTILDYAGYYRFVAR